MNNNEKKELIAFYNVENLFPPDAPKVHRLDPTVSGFRNWDERKYQNKLYKIAQVFNLIHESEGVLPMIIGLSEIYGQQPLDELIKMPPFNSNYGVIHYDSMDERGVDVALLYDQSKIKIISSEPITYFFEFEETDPGKYDTTRDVLYCKVNYLGEILHVFVVHLPSKREKDVNKPKRNYILKELHERTMDVLEKTNEAILICGDFNENPDEESLDKMLYDSNFNNVFTNPYKEFFKNNIFSTYHYKNGLLFDQMILSNSFFQSHSLLQFKNAKVFNHGKLMNTEEGFKGRPFRTYAGTRYLGGYSDHFPIFIELQINGH